VGVGGLMVISGHVRNPNANQPLQIYQIIKRNCDTSAQFFLIDSRKEVTDGSKHFFV